MSSESLPPTALRFADVIGVNAASVEHSVPSSMTLMSVKTSDAADMEKT
jgi:hypothetical protein